MKILIACLATVLVSTGAMAGTRAFNLSLTPDIAIYPRTDTIEGLTLSIWGENQQSGLALGIVNGSAGDSAGVSLGCLNYGENYKGLQWGLVNYTKHNSAGFQGGFIFGFLASGVNYVGGNMTGFYTAVFNYAGNLTGLELGLINYAENADSGVQIGLINIINQNKSWFGNMPSEVAPVMIFVNWRF